MTDRPAFAQRYPKDAELDALVDAFTRGDYARVREQAPLLAERASDASVRAAARDLRRRIAPSPLAIYLLGLGVILLILLSWRYASR